MPNEFFFQSNSTTILLEGVISKFNSFEEFEKKYSDEMLKGDSRLGNYLDDLVYKSGKKAHTVSEDAHLSSAYVEHIINKRTKQPKRDPLICIAFAVGATVEELGYLLKYAGLAPLYVRRKRDVIIWFGLMKGEALETVNNNLIDRGLAGLYDPDKK